MVHITSESEWRTALENRESWLIFPQQFTTSAPIDLRDYGDPWPMTWVSAGPHRNNIVRTFDGPVVKFGYRRLDMLGMSFHEEPGRKHPHPFVQFSGLYGSMWANNMFYKSGGDGMSGGSFQVDTTWFINNVWDRNEGRGFDIRNAIDVHIRGRFLQRNGAPSRIIGGGEDPETRGPFSIQGLHIEDSDLFINRTHAGKFESNYVWSSAITLGGQTEAISAQWNALYDSEINDETERTVTKTRKKLSKGFLGLATVKTEKYQEKVSKNKVENNYKGSFQR